MLRRFSLRYVLLSLFLDVACVTGALILAHSLRQALPYGLVDYNPLYPEGVPATEVYGIVALLWIVIAFTLSLYDPKKIYKAVDEYQTLTLTVAFYALAAAGMLYFTYRQTSRMLMIYAFGLTWLSMLAWRAAMRLLHRTRASKAQRTSRVLIAGAGEVGQRVAAMIREYHWTGLQLEGYLDDDPAKHDNGLPVLGALDDIERVVRECEIDNVILALPPQAHERVNLTVSRLHKLPVRVRVVPDYFSLALYRATIDDFGGIPMINLRDPALSPYQRLGKRALDIAVGGALTLCALPLMGVIAAAIKLDSPGPVLFKQPRAGENGRIFKMYKFRSMVQNAEKLQAQINTHDEEGHVIHKQENDPRVTRVGRFIRHWSLDELPQFFNVLKGDMSLVGPRLVAGQRALGEHDAPAHRRGPLLHPELLALARYLHPAQDAVGCPARQGGLLIPARSREALAWLGIVLVAAGTGWTTLRAPSLWGWAPALLGLLLLSLAQRAPIRTPLDPPLRLIGVMMAVSLLITAFPETTQVQVSRLAAGLVLTQGLCAWASSRTRLLWMGRGLVLAGAAIALAAPFVVDWLRNKAFLVPPAAYEVFPRVVTDAVHPNVMASLLVLLLPLPVAWLCAPAGPATSRRRSARVRRRPLSFPWSSRTITTARKAPRSSWTTASTQKSLWRLTLILACGLMGAALLLTKSRGGYIAAAVGVILAVWFVGRRSWAIGLLAAALAALIGFLVSTQGNDAPDLVAGAADPSTLAFRLNVWRIALWMLQDFSFTGAGMGTFNDVGALLYPFYETQNPGAHNLYLQVGVDLGIPGLIALLATLMLTLWLGARTLCGGTLCRRSRRRLSQARDAQLQALTAGALAGIIGLMVHGLVDITLWNTRAAPALWVMIAFVVALSRQAAASRSCC